MEFALNIRDYEELINEIDLTDTYLEQLINYYHLRLLNNKFAIKELVRNGISRKVIKVNRFGYCDRTLNRIIPQAKNMEGAAYRGCLQRNHLLKESGHELFRGCVVEPFFDDKSRLVAMCGLKIKRIGRPAPKFIQWYRERTYESPVHFKLLAGIHQ